jgi:hypothetical protein
MDPYDVTAAMMSDDEDVDWITRIDSIQENSTQTEKFSVPSTVSEIIIKTGIQFLLGLNFTGCKSVTIQDSVVIYDRLDFTGCEGVTIGNDVKVHGAVAFVLCRNVTIGTGLKVYGGATFRDCTNVTIGKGLEVDGHAFFQNNTKMTVNVPLNARNLSLSNSTLDFVPEENSSSEETAAITLTLRGTKRKNQKAFNIRENLKIESCQNIDKLLADIIVGRNLTLLSCENLKHISTEIVVGGNLEVTRCNQCEGFKPILGTVVIQGNLNINNCDSFKNMPLTLKVSGNFSLHGCNTLEILPERTIVDGSSYIGFCDEIEQFPHNFFAGKKLRLVYCPKLVNLSGTKDGTKDDLTVESLQIQYCSNLKTISPNLTVFGDVLIWFCENLENLVQCTLSCNGNIKIEKCHKLKLVAGDVIHAHKIILKDCNLLNNIAHTLNIKTDLVIENCTGLSELLISNIISLKRIEVKATNYLDYIIKEEDILPQILLCQDDVLNFIHKMSLRPGIEEYSIEKGVPLDIVNKYSLDENIYNALIYLGGPTKPPIEQYQEMVATKKKQPKKRTRT